MSDNVLCTWVTNTPVTEMLTWKWPQIAPRAVKTPKNFPGKHAPRLPYNRFCAPTPLLLQSRIASACEFIVPSDAPHILCTMGQVGLYMVLFFGLVWCSAPMGGISRDYDIMVESIGSAEQYV